MKINKVALLIAFAIASVLFLEVAAHADEMDQCTKITFSQPIADSRPDFAGRDLPVQIGGPKRPGCSPYLQF